MPITADPTATTPMPIAKNGKRVGVREGVSTLENERQCDPDPQCDRRHHHRDDVVEGREHDERYDPQPVAAFEELDPVGHGDLLGGTLGAVLLALTAAACVPQRQRGGVSRVRSPSSPAAGRRFVASTSATVRGLSA